MSCSVMQLERDIHETILLLLWYHLLAPSRGKVCFAWLSFSCSLPHFSSNASNVLTTFSCKIIRTMSRTMNHVPEQRDVGSVGRLPCDSFHLALNHMKQAPVLFDRSVNIRHCVINNVWIMCLILLLVLRCNGRVLGNTDVYTLSRSGCFPTRWFSMTRSGTNRFEAPTASVWRHPEVKKLQMRSLSRFRPQLHDVEFCLPMWKMCFFAFPWRWDGTAGVEDHRHCSICWLRPEWTAKREEKAP